MTLELGFAAEGGQGWQQRERALGLGCSRVQKGTSELEIRARAKAEVPSSQRGDADNVWLAPPVSRGS